MDFYIILFIIAFLYSAVGHGGASGYLALMALYGIAPEVMKPTALMLNSFFFINSVCAILAWRTFKLKNGFTACSCVNTNGIYWWYYSNT